MLHEIAAVEPLVFVHFSQTLIFPQKALEGDVTSPYILCVSKKKCFDTRHHVYTKFDFIFEPLGTDKKPSSLSPFERSLL